MSYLQAAYSQATILLWATLARSFVFSFGFSTVLRRATFPFEGERDRVRLSAAAAGGIRTTASPGVH